MNQTSDFIIRKTVSGEYIKSARARLHMSQRELADLIGVSKKTIERWESSQTEISGPVIFLLRILTDNPSLIDKVRIPKKIYPLRLKYMYKDDVCTIIDVDDVGRQIHIYNYTSNLQYRAFGVVETPSYDDYEEFLESRCFPRTRDKMKLILDELGLPFYDPMLIIEKTEGRMAEDNFHIEIER